MASDNDLLTPVPQSGDYFDVFLNHRGPDVKHTFVKALDEGLRAAGVCPFLHAHDIERGKKTWEFILEAIRVALVSICVFSPGYAESSWCLDELAAIHRSGVKQILPVFYHVKPFHLRWPEKGPFAEGLSKQRERHGEEKVADWRDCLARSADLYGFELESFAGSERSLVQAIVSKVLQYLKSLFPVGLDQRTAELSSILLRNLEKGPCILGIFGTGGIGKTTFAEAVFERLKDGFTASSFLADVTRELSRGDLGLVSLQRVI